jgi:Domain of unknown function (DUF4129)
VSRVSGTDHLAQAHAAALHTAPLLPAARVAAEAAVGVPHHSEGWLTRQLSRLLDTVGDLLGRFFGWLFGLMPSLSFSGGGGVVGGLLGLITWLVVIAVVGGAVVLLALGLSRWRPKLPERSATSDGPVPETPYDQARASALSMARSDPREALRILYVALLHELGRRRGWKPPPGRSNWAFVRRLDQRTAPGAALAECTRLFEGRVYGHVTAGEGDVLRVAELSDTVLA